MDVFKTVSPDKHEITTSGIGKQCPKVVYRDKEYYVYIQQKELNYKQFLKLDTIRKVPDTDGLYNYIIYKNQRGKLDIIFAKHVLPNEMGSKHFYLYTLISRENLTPEMSVYMAGELFKQGDTYEINFQSGTYTLGYKEKWQQYLKEDTIVTPERLEEYWFDHLKQIFQENLRSETIYYRNDSLFETYELPFYPKPYQTLESMDIKVRFFTNQKYCYLYPVKLLIDQGKRVSSIATRKVRDMIQNERGVITIKPEYREVAEGYTINELERGFSGAGKRFKHSKKKYKKHKKNTRRKRSRRNMKPKSRKRSKKSRLI